MPFLQIHQLTTQDARPDRVYINPATIFVPKRVVMDEFLFSKDRIFKNGPGLSTAAWMEAWKLLNTLPVSALSDPFSDPRSPNARETFFTKDGTWFSPFDHLRVHWGPKDLAAVFHAASRADSFLMWADAFCPDLSGELRERADKLVVIVAGVVAIDAEILNVLHQQRAKIWKWAR